MKFIKENKLLKNSVCVILSYLSTQAFSYILKLGKSDFELFSMLDYGYSWLTIFIFGFGIFLISRFILLDNKRIKIYAFLVGLFISVITVWGAYSLFINDIFISGKTSILQIFLMLGLNVIISPLVAEIFVLMERFGKWYETKKESETYAIKNNLIYFLIVWGMIFLCYMPVFFAYWPGNFIYDAPYQISEVIYNSYKDHHPLLHTWLMGTSYNLGVEWGNPAKGFQLYTLFQMLVLSSSFAYCLLYLRKKVLQSLSEYYRFYGLLCFL